MIRQFTNHFSVAAAGRSRSARSTRAHWLCVCVLCALAGCAEHTGANQNANEPDDVEDASTRDHDSKHEDAAGSAAEDDALAVANGGKGGASGAAPAASAAGHAAVSGGAGDASQAAGATAQGGAGAGGMTAPVVGGGAGAPAAGGANAAGGPAAAGGSGAMASAGAAASPAASGGAATAAAGTSALPGAGAAGAPVPLGPPGSNTAWLGGGQPVPCSGDEHCVKSLYTPICNLTKGVCDVCPDMAQENALATRVNACILAASPRCLNDEECRFGDCITSCDGP